MKNPSTFPSPGVVMTDGRQQGCYEGMTLRDYFAAAALQGFCSGPEYGLAENKAAGLTWIQVTTKYAYKIADAMLEEREREE